jgi:hypothetical protein
MIVVKKKRRDRTITTDYQLARAIVSLCFVGTNSPKTDWPTGVKGFFLDVNKSLVFK